ncbi:MAG: glutamine synthetase family protein [candidate division WOR-3 bacterium]
MKFTTKQEVLSYLQSNPQVKFVRFLFPDVLGRLMSFTVPSNEMESAFDEGKGFDGSSVEGFARIYESDLVFLPDPSTFRVIPWEYNFAGVKWYEALVFGDIFDSKGNHFPGDSRFVLKRTIEKFEKEFGKLYVGPEVEFFIFENEHSTALTDSGGYFHSGKFGEVRKASMIYLEQMGISVECDHHEVAPGQHEIDLKYGDALEIADSVMLTKYVLKKVADMVSLYVSFMPKPVTGIPGNGMHLHMSLWKDGKNTFFEGDGLSNIGKQFLMGLIKYGREIQLVLNQWINSYKRLVPGFEAPVYLAWGTKNRSAYIRVPEYRKGMETATRIELRSPDPACNIYLALSLILGAGVQGIKEMIPIMPAQEDDIFHLTESEREKRGIRVLCENLSVALNEFKRSTLAREILGEHIFNKIVENKKIEWEEYERAVGKRYDKEVSPYEVERYLPTL